MLIEWVLLRYASRSSKNWSWKPTINSKTYRVLSLNAMSIVEGVEESFGWNKFSADWFPSIKLVSSIVSFLCWWYRKGEGQEQSTRESLLSTSLFICYEKAFYKINSDGKYVFSIGKFIKIIDYTSNTPVALKGDLSVLLKMLSIIVDPSVSL